MYVIAWPGRCHGRERPPMSITGRKGVWRLSWVFVYVVTNRELLLPRPDPGTSGVCYVCHRVARSMSWERKAAHVYHGSKGRLAAELGVCVRGDEQRAAATTAGPRHIGGLLCMSSRGQVDVMGEKGRPCLSRVERAFGG